MISFSDNELNSIEEFESKHLGCYKNFDHTGFTINQEWTGIGVRTIITCNCCGETKDITDYNCW